MYTRFIIPAMVATAFHALVFVGFNDRSTPERTPPEPDSPKLRPMPKELIEVAIDEVVPAPADKESKPQRLGSEDAYRPQLPPETPERKVEWPVPLEPIYPGPVTITDKIPTGIFGAPDGEEAAEWTDRPVISFQHLDDPPRTRAQAAPVYPSEARTAGLEGEVMVEFVVDESGRVMHARVTNSTHAMFEGPTLRAVQNWRFEPGKKLGRAVRFRMVVPVVFSLSN